MQSSLRQLVQNKVGLLTGAGSGLGRAAALMFAREGGLVVVADLDERGGTETARMIKNDGGHALFVKADVSDASQVQALVRKTIEAFGRFDCAVNSAGIEGDGSNTLECSEMHWKRVIDINLTGLWLCMKYELPAMLECGGGAIVNVSSIAGLKGIAGLPAYVASKHGVIGLTKTAAVEFASSGIRINVVCPGSCRTALTERVLGPELNGLAEATPMRRVASAEEIAASLVWLCSDSCSFMTGAVISIDGGKSAN